MGKIANSAGGIAVGEVDLTLRGDQVMEGLFHDRATCRLCASSDLALAMSLVPTPVGDKYLPAERREETRETIPLDLYLCGGCGHLQTGAVANPNAVFKHYLSRPAAVNPVISDAFKEYAEGILSGIRPDKDSLIFEIGSNDGAFLNFFKEHGMPVLGVDPAYNLAEAATNSGIPTLPTFFSSEVAHTTKKEHGTASVVVTNFTLASMDDLDDATRGIHEMLSADGVFMFETQYRVDTFQRHLLETINTEQLSIFSVKPLSTFFHRHGLQLINVQRVPSKGGSIRCTVQRSGGPRAISPTVQEHISLEDRLGVYNLDFYEPCASHVQAVRKEMAQVLAPIKAQGKIVAGYGTSIGATILTYQLELGEAITFFVDDDPYRQNLVSPGYHIPVLAPQALLEQNPDYVLIMAPLYAEQIIRKNRAYLDRGGHFVTVWPEVEIR